MVGSEAADRPVGEGDATPRERRRGALATAMLAAIGAVLLVLFALSGSTVAADGTLVEPFAVLASGTLALVGAGLLGLVLMFRDIRRRSTCGRGNC